jgi:hypothetical protein
MGILMHITMISCLQPCPHPLISHFMTESNLVEHQNKDGSDNFNLNELRKRRGSYPQLNKSEILSAEMLAPLPQGNISRTISRDFLDDESKPLLKVKKNIKWIF